MVKYIEPDPRIEGWMAGEELQWLYEKASEMNTIVEVGSWMGRSTHALLSGCKGMVIAVDHFRGNPSERGTAHKRAQTEDIFKIFQRNVGHFSNLLTLRRDSIEAAALFGLKSIEMIFIDGEHEYPAPKNDIQAWLPKCKKLICGHDLAQDGVPRALKEIFQDRKIEINRAVGSIWSVEIGKENHEIRL